MHTTVTTTITTRLDLDSMTPDHSVSIDAEDVLPRSIILALVEGGCKATMASLGSTVEYEVVEDDAEAEDDE